MNAAFYINAADFESFSNEELENSYQGIFKPFLTFLYANENIRVFLSINGIQLTFLCEKHGEAIELIRAIMARGQLELSGGGYFNPIFPLLFPVDRTGQIEKMNTILRSSLGKRPSGITMFKSIWDSSLVTAFHSCGFEYAILDSTLYSQSKITGEPLIVSDLGRSLKVLLSYKVLKPLRDEKYNSWQERILKVQKPNGLVVIPFTVREFSSLCTSRQGAAFFEALSKDEQLNLILPSVFIKSCRQYKSTYIAPGMDCDIAVWAKKAFVRTEVKGRLSYTIHDYLNIYSQNRRLYERMIFVSMLISQIHGGDKIRKAQASLLLWESQCGFNYINCETGTPAVASARHRAFELLNRSEKLVRECKDFRETVTSFDYNSDGLDEYVYQMENFHAVVSPCGANLIELDSLKTFKNYAANLQRMELYDGIDDVFKRGFFTDHFIEQDALQKYTDKKICSAPTFEDIIFEEKKFDSKRFDLLLEAQAEFSQAKLPVSLRKRFTATSSGFTVQYIIRNEGPLPVRGVFITELNFCCCDFITSAKDQQFKCELISKGTKTELPASSSLNISKGVSFLQVNDELHHLSFVVEPNEECGFTSSVLNFTRPTGEKTAEKTSKTLVCSFYWNVEIHSGMEIEKFINFTLVPQKKKK